MSRKTELCDTHLAFRHWCKLPTVNPIRKYEMGAWTILSCPAPSCQILISLTRVKARVAFIISPRLTSEMVPNLNLTPRTKKTNCGLFRSSDLPNSSKHKFANPVRHRNSSKSEHVLKSDLLSTGRQVAHRWFAATLWNLSYSGFASRYRGYFARAQPQTTNRYIPTEASANTSYMSETIVRKMLTDSSDSRQTSDSRSIVKDF